MVVVVVVVVINLFNGLFSGTTWVSRYQKGKTSLDLNKARDDGVLGCSGISWTICKQSAPRSRQITTPTPYLQDLENVCPGICLAMMQTQMPKYTCPHTSVLCSNSFFAISLQHVTVMDIYSSMDAAIILYIDMVSLYI